MNDSLRHKLDASQGNFYRAFLCPLFFEGFALREKERTDQIRELLGRVPYLNGGLFNKHQIEQDNGEDIEIPDAAFDKLFTFFDSHDWHLDDRPLRSGKEINPDVLGYIFEKYINQKQMGAYYTKEDITEYIGKNTIIPFLLAETRTHCQVAFSGDQSIWKLLAADPDRYVYDAVKHGYYDESGAIRPLPEHIAGGLDDVARRDQWNRTAEAEYALPTEIWREVAARRRRFEEVRAKLAAGEVTEINDLITYNLNIRQFAQDAIETWDGTDMLRAFWTAIRKVTILDPTCGSGAFLFAALQILEPLYESCLDRMESFIADADQLGRKYDYADFCDTIKQVKKHPSRAYYVYKSIIVNNLFGVDIMEEATEICKLRLFLKLAAQVEPDFEKDNLGIEPLPDIDFNIRAGNTLVGFATEADVKKALLGGAQLNLVMDDRWPDFERRLREVRRKSELFQQLQTTMDFDATALAKLKAEWSEEIGLLSGELDLALAGLYGCKESSDISRWRASHRPFHWFVVFYGVMSSGGFNVIIGNPPYVEYSEVKSAYTILGYQTEPCGNLYAYLLERCMALDAQRGRMGFIVPVSSVSTEGYASLQELLKARDLHFSSFDDRPSRLFDGLEHIRLTIHIMGETTQTPCQHSTRYNKWSAVERASLFQTLQFTAAPVSLVPSSFPKLTSDLELGICKKLRDQRKKLALYYRKDSRHRVLYSRKVGYFLQVLNFQPEVRDGEGSLRPPSEFKEIRLSSEAEVACVLCALNSSLFYWFVTVFSDCRHLNKREIDNFPIDIGRLAEGPLAQVLVGLADELMADIVNKSEYRTMRFKHDALSVQCILPRLSKSIIDDIDRALAVYYGFTVDETDFIINYDIKFRQGRCAED